MNHAASISLASAGERTLLKPLSNKYSPFELERTVQDQWRRDDVLRKLEEKRKTAEWFRFLEGPPTANGFMHIGHFRGRTMKDVVLRYQSMQGKKVWRRAGWDCQGLPVELEVEKKLGVTAKREIEKIGLARFVEECHKLVDSYIQHWRITSERLGLWLNYDEAYETRRDIYIEFVWWFLKVAYGKGFLYEDYKVVPTCPRCETPLSSHEVALGYTNVKDPSLYVKFQLQDNPREYVLVWTTTPWTLPGDEAVTVHPNLQYVKVEVKDERWILAKDLLGAVMTQLKIKEYIVLDTFLGSELEGVKYIHPLLEETPIHRNHQGKFDHALILGEHVTVEEGTGCVHTAPAHGVEDHEVGIKYGIPLFCPVDIQGRFTVEAGKYSGAFVKDADSIIIQDLKKSGALISAGEIQHEYPLCWRCEAPLIYRLDRQWFLRVSRVRREMLDENDKVNWYPDWAGKSRFGEWLTNAEDWCISRSRIWGTPLNIWCCSKCMKRLVVGTRAELEKHAINLPENLELHRPWIDEVRLKCDDCGGEMQRVPFVTDCWLDSGVAHAASVDYLKDNSLFKELFPYDFITEAVDQTRGWFYSMLVTSTVLFGLAPYRSVLCQGHVLDKEGQKMSKSRNNVVWGKDALEKHGADTVRAYLLLKAAPEDALAYDEDEISQVNRLLNIVWNIYSFATTYMALDRFDPRGWSWQKVEPYLNLEDRWLLSRCQTTTQEVTDALNKFKLHKAIRAVLDFAVEDISRLYIRLIRRRTWIEPDNPEKTATYWTLHTVLSVLVKLLAPFTPHLAETLYSVITDEKREVSVHLETWPTAKEEMRKEQVERDMEICKDVVKGVLTARQRKQVKLRWPLKALVISPRNIAVKQALERCREIILAQTNVKDVEILEAEGKPPFATVAFNPLIPKIAPLFKEATPRIIRSLESMPSSAILGELQKTGYVTVKVNGNSYHVTSEMLDVREVYPSDISTEIIPSASIYLDTSKTKELLAESTAREVVRRAQVMRKEMGLRIEEFVEMILQPENPESLPLLEAERDYISSEVRAKMLLISRSDEILHIKPTAYVKEWIIDDEKLKIVMARVENS